MKTFMDKDFLLQNKTAKQLYINAAKDMPIFDYHCHLNPKEIADNISFNDLTEIWLLGDHYKWRAMRTYGIKEEFITGNASNYDKFMAWAETIQNLIGNPLYAWTHLELQRFFGITEPLSVKSAPQIWEKTKSILSEGKFCVSSIFEQMNVYAVGTTDDPCDSLEFHKAIKEGKAKIGNIKTKVLPSFRPDKALAINTDYFASYIKKLEEVSEIKISTTDDVIKALIKRLDFFSSMGCCSADHGFKDVPFALLSNAEIDNAFTNALNGEKVSVKEEQAFQTKIYTELAHEYAKRGIVMQFHMGALRNNSKKSFDLLGADTGFDASLDVPMSENLSGLLSHIEQTEALPKTILYSLNPKDYYSLATLMGCFQGNGIKGKIQFGSAWWFCDHKDGMEEQLHVLASTGMLSAFVGMLTDSRSFLSYPRHEYFRRILCNMIGKIVENGEFPYDKEYLYKLVKDISFNNAKNYFTSLK